MSVFPSIVPFRKFVTTSSRDTGPTWCPPMAMNHWSSDIASVSRFRWAVSTACCGLRLWLGVDPLRGVLLELLHGRRIQREQVRQFRQVDTLGARRLFVAPDNAECEHVERRPRRLIGHARYDLGKRPRLGELLLHYLVHAGDARLFQNREPLLVVDRSIGIGG